VIYPLIVPLIFITLSGWRALIKARADIDLFDRCAGRVVDIVGLVIEKKESLARIALDSLNCDGREIALDGTAYASIKTKNTGIRPGDSVAGSIICNTYHPHNGLLYGREVGIGLSYQERPPPTSVSGIAAQCAAMHAHSISVFEKILSPHAYQLVTSLFLGKVYEEREARSAAQNWGILHLLARSGLHLALILWIVRKLLLLMPCKPAVVSAIEWGALILYTSISIASFSYLRALSMAAIGILCAFWYRRVSALMVWWYGCALILIAYPWALFALDFQLSALATYAIIIEARAYRL
jgi:hypothetical protein